MTNSPHMYHTIISLLLVSLLSSCSNFLDRIDGKLIEKDVTDLKGSEKKTFCQEHANIQVISEDQKASKLFIKFIQEQQSELKLEFIDKVILWSLIQMNLRPDLSSPSSKLQVFLKINGRDDYFHFFSKSENSLSFLNGLESLLKKYKSKYDLVFLIRLIDKKYPRSYQVSEDFEDFLNEHRLKLLTHQSLKNKYFRGDETLRENENITPENLESIYTSYKKNKDQITYETNQKLFEHQKSNFISHCNYDMNLYAKSDFLIHKKIVTSHQFGLKQGANFFIAATTHDIFPIQNIANTGFFKGQSLSRSAAFCKFKLEDDKSLWIMSSNSRDPGQHLYHLIEYGISKIESIDDLDTIMRYSRHLFLENPNRLILESKRSTKEQLNRILKIDIPIYNADKLGNIWGGLKSKNQIKFIIDDRSSSHLLCK